MTCCFHSLTTRALKPQKILLLLLSVLIGMACRQATEQIEMKGSVRGTVRCLREGGAEIVCLAFIFSGGSYLAATDEQGFYQIDTLTGGQHEITASALFCGDTTLSVEVKGGRTITLDFYLTPDSSTGKIFGEFEDGTLYQQRLMEDSSLANWSEQHAFDVATGATLQYKTLKIDPGDRKVFLGDTLVATADAWGQYYLTIPCGTYPLTGSCAGYENVTRVLRARPNSRNYLNFILPREKGTSQPDR
jgi:hypothetical protein